METTASMEGRPHRREHRRGGGRFRAEIAMDRGSPPIPRGPDYGFAAAVREPLVRLQRPKFDFERWDWDYFAWPHDRLDANLGMRDSDPEATLEADRKASDSFMNRGMLRLKRYAMDQDTQEQHTAAWSHEQLHAIQGMKDCNHKGTLDADQKASESLLSRRGPQLKKPGMDQDQHAQEQQKEPNKKASEGFLGRSRLQLKRREMDQDQRKELKLRTLDSCQKENQGLLGQSTLRLKRHEIAQDQHTQEQHKEPELRTSLLVDGKPAGHRSTRRRLGCAEANRILDHGGATTGSWAC